MNKYTNSILNEHGQIISSVEKAEIIGTEVHRCWSSSGVLTLEATILDGEYHGSYRSWWDNGVLKEEGAFNHGKRVGIYRWYTEEGLLWQELNFGDAL